MKLKFYLPSLLFMLFACQKKTEPKSVEKPNTAQEIAPQKTIALSEKASEFDFEKFRIEKAKVGPIKIGMTIYEAENFLKNLNKSEAEAYDFGFDGGGKAYLYSFEGEFILALIPKMDSDEILAIAVLSKKLKTVNGLNPKSSVQEIQKKYPGIQVNLNLMMNWEDLHDEKNNFDFVFMTNEDNRIGEYTETETTVSPKRTTSKADWITIR
jgi:hypothetical protein